jgi:hypothetical protein
MTTAVSPAVHKTVLGRLLASIGSIITNLLNGAKKGYQSLPADQQDAIVKGVNISQILKSSYAQGETAVVNLVASKVGVSPDIASAAILAIAEASGIKTGKIQDYLDSIANKVQDGVTDNEWNSLWQTGAQFAASYLSGGSLNWVSLSLGVIEFAYQHFIKK